MTTWLGLIVAPVLALADQSVALSLSAWSCKGQHGLALHLVHASFTAAVAVIAALGWFSWRRAMTIQAGSPGAARHRFLATMAAGVSALSLLAILAMWGPTWVLSSCLR